MNNKLIIAIFTAFLLMAGCRTVPSSDTSGAITESSSVDSQSASAAAGEESASQPVSLPFPFLGANSDSDFELQSMLSGTVSGIVPDELGTSKLILETSQNYYLEGREQTLVYEFVFGGLKELMVEPGDKVVEGQFLALASSDSYITARSTELADFLVRMSQYQPVLFEGFWYFSPTWVMPGSTRWLSFRQVPDFEAAVADFYNRWAVEENEARGVTLHYFPNLDRIRAVLSFTDYPVYAESSPAVSLVENAYYGSQHAFVLRNVMEDMDIEGHSVVLMWQNNFDQYLREEYTPGEEIYIYGSVYVIDHMNREILVFIRDFSFIDDESVIDARKKAALE